MSWEGVRSDQRADRDASGVPQRLILVETRETLQSEQGGRQGWTSSLADPVKGGFGPLGQQLPGGVRVAHVSAEARPDWLGGRPNQRVEFADFSDPSRKALNAATVRVTLRAVTSRTRYANDLGVHAALVAVTDNVNQPKGHRDLAGWLPPRGVVRVEVFSGAG